MQYHRQRQRKQQNGGSNAPLSINNLKITQQISTEVLEETPFKVSVYETKENVLPSIPKGGGEEEKQEEERVYLLEMKQLIN